MGRHAASNWSRKEIDFLLLPLRLLVNAGAANTVPPAICWIACANTSRLSWPSWRTCVWILITIWRSVIFGWSKCNKRSPDASVAWLVPKPSAAFAAMCPRCANKACLCCRLCKPLCVVIPSFLHSSGPGQLQKTLLNIFPIANVSVGIGHFINYGIDMGDEIILEVFNEFFGKAARTGFYINKGDHLL